MSTRRYSAEEVEGILRRATEHESSAGLRLPGPEGSEGLTLNEIVAAAREAGIDPLAVRRAAILRSRTPRSGPGLLAGGPLVHRMDGRLPAASAPALPDDLKELDALVERTLGRSGTGRVLEDGYRWSGGGSSVEVRAREEGLELRIELDALGRYAGLVGVVALAFLLFLQPFGGLPALLGALGPFAGTLVTIAAPFVLVRPLWRAWSAERRGRVEALAMALTERLEVPDDRMAEPDS